MPPPVKGVTPVDFAVIAAYRDLERASWRGSVVVAPNRTLVVRVELGARSLAIARP